jgi:hypothetical protein
MAVVPLGGVCSRICSSCGCIEHKRVVMLLVHSKHDCGDIRTILKWSKTVLDNLIRWTPIILSLVRLCLRWVQVRCLNLFGLPLEKKVSSRDYLLSTCHTWRANNLSITWQKSAADFGRRRTLNSEAWKSRTNCKSASIWSGVCGLRLRYSTNALNSRDSSKSSGSSWVIAADDSGGNCWSLDGGGMDDAVGNGWSGGESGWWWTFNPFEKFSGIGKEN